MKFCPDKEAKSLKTANCWTLFQSLTLCNNLIQIILIINSIVLLYYHCCYYYRFKFPSILFVYIVVLYSIWRKLQHIMKHRFYNFFTQLYIAASILINLLSGRTLFCSDDDLIKSLEEPTPYCIISGLYAKFPKEHFLAD